MKPANRLAVVLFCGIVLLLCGSLAAAQSSAPPSGDPTDSSSRTKKWAARPTDDAAGLRGEHWNYGVFVGGGSGVGARSDVQMFRAGARVGRVLTGELGQGWARGTFEWDAEIAPVDSIFWSGYKNVYGFGAMPVILTWNFTGGRQKVVPFVQAVGGILWTSSNVPPGDTSQINFTPGGGGGVHMFVKRNQSLDLTVRIVHVSSASLGNKNPGINASVQGTLAYTWYRVK